MIEQVSFEYELPNGQVLYVVAEVDPGEKPEQAPGIDPGIDGRVEITQCLMYDLKPLVHYNIESIGVRMGTEGKFISLNDILEEKAWDEYDQR